MAVDEQIYLHGTLRERFVAAAARDDETVAQRLQPLIESDEPPVQQREDAWRLLSAGIQWAARALSAAGLSDITVAPVRDSEAAFAHAQRLEQQLFALSQLRDRSHDREALVVDAVKRACYAGAELGPVPGGRLAIPGSIVNTVAPSEEYLQEVGSDLGEALRRLNGLALADVVEETTKALADAPLSERATHR
jgi:hypothetical protein